MTNWILRGDDDSLPPSQGCWPIDLLQTGRRHLCCRHSVNTQTPKSVHLCRLSGQPFLQPARSCCPGGVFGGQSLARAAALYSSRNKSGKGVDSHSVQVVKSRDSVTVVEISVRVLNKIGVKLRITQ